MSMYCTVGDVTERLGIITADDDPLILSIIVACSELVDRHCLWPTGAFAVETATTRYYDDSAVRYGVLSLDVPLAVAPTGIVNGNATAVTSTWYRLQPRNEWPKYSIHLLNSYSWLFDVDGEIAITGKFGYSTTPPAAIKEATAEYAAWSLKRYQSALQDSTANFELGRLVYSKPIPVQVSNKLAAYKAKIT